MQGIFLHILADTLGSFTVILSTLLTMFDSWHGWDPLATGVITLLLVLSAYQLVNNTSKRLLGKMPDNIDYEIGKMLQGLVEIPGVVGYKGAKFHVLDADGHGITHEHKHDHDHDRNSNDECSDHHDSSDHDHTDSDSDKSEYYPHPHLEVDKHHIYGTLHVFAAKDKDLCMMDVYERVDEYTKSRGFEMNLQIERTAGKLCWCGRK
jgi:solute carrier family 30 (zinc transporter), member 5/7